MSRDDCLNVVVAPAFARSQTPDLGQSLDPRRVVGLVVVPVRRLAHYHRRPPSTFPLDGHDEVRGAMICFEQRQLGSYGSVADLQRPP